MGTSSEVFSQSDFGGAPVLIFVTIGNPTQPFLRLLKAVDQYAGQHLYQNEEKFFIQSGNNPDFHPSHCEYSPFVSMEEFEHYMEMADVVICHGGCGSIGPALRSGKVPVVVPRRKKYGEHVNDHQMQLTKVLADEGRVVPVYEIEKLSSAIAQARGRQAQPISTTTPRLLTLVSHAIEELVAPS